MSETAVASFVMRFVRDDPSEDKMAPAAWRGTIRHVQTSEEMRFTSLPEALHFVARFVDIDSTRPDQQA